jgi:hypothetical protein
LRTTTILLTFTLFIGIWEGKAKADRIQLPCDADMSASAGTGIFTGNTNTSSGAVNFTRIQPAFLRLETTLFDNCETVWTDDNPDQPDKTKRLSPHDRVTRRWFGRLSLYGAVTPETTSLGFKYTPKKSPVLDDSGNATYDEMGEPVTMTENSVIKASLEAGTDFSWGAGGKLSVFDGHYVHLDAYFEGAGSFGQNPARPTFVGAHALDLDIDITALVNQNAQFGYNWHTWGVGATIGLPFRPEFLSNLRLTPFLSVGYTRLRAEVNVKLNDSALHALETFGINPELLTKPRKTIKDTPTALVGLRLDFNDRVSAEAEGSYAQTSYTTAYWFTGSVIVHFDHPWRW